MIDLAKTRNVFAKIIFHAAFHPVDNLTEALTAHVHEQDAFILLADLLVRESGFQIFGYGIVDNRPEIPLEDASIYRSENMINCLPVFAGKIHSGIQTLFKRGRRGIALNNAVAVFFGNIFHQCGHVLIVIVERVSVDTAFTDNILNSDLTVWMLQ